MSSTLLLRRVVAAMSVATAVRRAASRGASCGSPQWVRGVRYAATTTTAATSVVSLCEGKLAKALAPAAAVKVIPVTGDPNGSHIIIEVISPIFEGKSLVQRHRLVLNAIGEELKTCVHAVDKITAKTPAEASKQ